MELAEGLRFNIQNFAIQYFEGNGPYEIAYEKTDLFKRYIEPVKDHKRYLISPERCSGLIQRFLWKVVALHIFGNFCWAGEAADAAHKLSTVLKPENQRDRLGSKDRDPEAERKFQQWSASTAALLTAAISATGSPRDREVSIDSKKEILDGIRDTIRPFRKSSSSEGFSHELSRIIGDAVAFDKEVSRQLARVEWVFGTDNNPGMAFDPRIMKLEKGQKQPAAARDVCLVIQPGMVKRGKSSGEDYGTEIVLLPMEVSVEPVVERTSDRGRDRR